MKQNIEFCTCTQTKCRWHPKNHTDGCTPCIQKNLKNGEIPSCFFNLTGKANQRKGDTIEDFAKLVLEK